MLVIGLLWALNPGAQPEPTAASLQPAAPAATEPIPQPPAPAAPGFQAETQALIAAALPPAQTTVQMLDAGGGAVGLQSAVSAARRLGYQVVATASSRQNVARTTVWFTAGKQHEAQALHARDPRFAELGPNRGLSSSVDLHVLVGPDWVSPLPPR